MAGSTVSAADVSLSGRQPKAVQTALRVLEEVARAGSGVTAKEIAEHLSLPSATTYRLLNLLTADGYIVRLPDLSGFSLGHRTAALIDAAVTPTVCTAAREVLTELRMSVRFGVHLFYFTNTAVRIADADAEFPPPVDDQVLNRHLHASAVGKLLLAEKCDAQTLLTLPLTALTAHTVTSRPALDTQLATIHTEGFALQTAELRDETACLAVGIRDHQNAALIAALAMSGRHDQGHLLLRQLQTITDSAHRLAPFLA